MLVFWCSVRQKTKSLHQVIPHRLFLLLVIRKDATMTMTIHAEETDSTRMASAVFLSKIPVETFAFLTAGIIKDYAYFQKERDEEESSLLAAEF